MVTQLQRQLYVSFSPNSREGIWEVTPNPGWLRALAFLPWIPPFEGPPFEGPLYGPVVLPRLLLPLAELSGSPPECARVMFRSSSAPFSSARESTIRHAGPGCYHRPGLRRASLHSETLPLVLSKPEIPGPEEATGQSLGQTNVSVGRVGPDGIFGSLQPHSGFLAPFLARTHVNWS